MISEHPTNYENGVVTYTMNNEMEYVECTYRVSDKIKSEQHQDVYYDWYQLDGEERNVDKTAPMRIALMEQSDVNSDQDEIIAGLYEQNLILNESLTQQVSINDAQDESIIEIYENLLS